MDTFHAIGPSKRPPIGSRSIYRLFSTQLFREQVGRSNDMGTIEYVTCRYDTVEVENSLKLDQTESVQD